MKTNQIEKTNAAGKSDSWLKNQIDTLNALVSLLVKIGAFLGTLVMAVYVAQTGFLPVGLTGSDSQVIIIALLVFSFVVTVGVLYGAASMLWLVFILDRVQQWRLNRWEQRGRIPAKQPKGMRLPSALRSWGLTAISLCVFGMFAFLLLIATPDQFPLLFRFLGGFILAGYLLLLLVLVPLIEDGTEEPLKGKKLFWATMVVAILTVPLLFGDSERVFGGVMRIAGVRYEGTPVELSAENMKQVQATATAIGIHVQSCPLSNTDHAIILGADVLWHGVGQRGQLRLHDSGAGKGSVRMSLDDSGIWPIRIDKGVVPACATKSP